VLFLEYGKRRDYRNLASRNQLGGRYVNSLVYFTRVLNPMMESVKKYNSSINEEIIDAYENWRPVK